MEGMLLAKLDYFFGIHEVHHGVLLLNRLLSLFKERNSLVHDSVHVYSFPNIKLPRFQDRPTVIASSSQLQHSNTIPPNSTLLQNNSNKMGSVYSTPAAPHKGT